ncbi:DUF829 domain-containing protein [Pelomyxa schiedti]|nr:DUF829 domain-containing protein [Pelomyxa schiedti]
MLVLPEPSRYNVAPFTACVPERRGVAYAPRGGRGWGGARAAGGGSASTTTTARGRVRVRVVLIGWFGCSARPLDKYRAMYAALGYRDTLCVMPPMHLSVAPRLRARMVGDVNRTLLADPERPIVFHLFSGNGAAFYASLLESWGMSCQQPPCSWEKPLKAPTPLQSLVKANVKGVIFDSAPPPLTLDMASEAITSAILGRLRSGSHKPPQYQHALISPVARGLCAVYMKHTPAKKCLDRLLHHLDNHQIPGTSQLFLYSDTDRLVPYTNVEKFASLQRYHGHSVRLEKFIGSHHVAHLLHSPQHYTDSVNKFLVDLGL